MNLPKFYDSKIREQIKRVKSLSFIPKDSKGNIIRLNYIDFINANKNIQYKTSVIKEAITYFSTGIDEGQKRINRIMYLTQQINITDQSVRNILATGIKEKGTIQYAKKKLRDELLKKAIDGQFIKVINKNGKDMMFNVVKYAEMVARTEILNSQTHATITTALEYNTDLVQVSSHNTTTELCQQYEGKIFSISGKDKDFPVLDNAPAFHPKCKHSITIIFREVLERRGIQKYIDFSQGKTYVHPTRQSHIPVNQRSA